MESGVGPPLCIGLSPAGLYRERGKVSTQARCTNQPPPTRSRKTTTLRPFDEHQLEVAPAQRPPGPPAVLDHPFLADRVHRRAAPRRRARRDRRPRTAAGSGAPSRREPPGFTAPAVRERRQHRAPLGDARCRVHLEHLQGRLRAGRLAGLANGLAQARAPDRGGLVEQAALVLRRRAERLDLERERLGRAPAARPAWAASASWIRSESALAWRRVTATRQVPPATKRADTASALSERPRRSRRASRRATSSSSARSSCWPEAASGRSSRSKTGSGGRRGSSGRSRSAREVVREQARVAEALGHRARGQRGDLAERADAEPLEDLRQRLQLRPGAQQRDRQRREEVDARPLSSTTCARRPAARPRLEGRRVGGEAAGRRAEARARAERPARRGEHAGEVAAVQAVEAGGLEEGRPGAVGLDLGADRLEPVEHAVPERAHALGIGRDQPQRRAARHRLAQPHPPHDPERLGRGGDLPHHLLAARLGRERDRLGQQRPPVPQRRKQLEAGVEDADDHDEHMFASGPAACKRDARRTAAIGLRAAYERPHGMRALGRARPGALRAHAPATMLATPVHATSASTSV